MIDEDQEDKQQVKLFADAMPQKKKRMVQDLSMLKQLRGSPRPMVVTLLYVDPAHLVMDIKAVRPGHPCEEI